jgi:DNA-binding transcriptional regulator YiaG
MSEELKRKIKEARALARVTQKQLAAMLGVPLRTLINWENNHQTPRGLALQALNQKLDEILAKK